MTITFVAVALAIGILIGLLLQQNMDNAQMTIDKLRADKANKHNGRLASIIHRQRVTIKNLKAMTPKSQITTAARTTVTRPNLPA